MMKLLDELKIKYICNCAVLVEIGGQKLLVDGLFWDDMPFDRMPEKTENDILNQAGDFEGLDVLLFTHCHEDHFSARKTVEFLKRNSTVLVAVPDMSGYSDADPKEKEAFAQASQFVRHDQDTEILRDYGNNVFYLEGEIGENHSIQLDTGVVIEYVKTGHLTFDYPEHYAVNIIGAESNVILTADMDLFRLENLKTLTMKKHAYIFVNNIALWHRSWRDEIDSMGFEKVFVYHTPSPENDSLGYRRKAEKCWGRYREQYPRWEALNIDEVH